jgi:hypothetical protein
MSSNPAGLSAALGNSRAAIHRFYDGLLELKRQSLANSPLLGQPVPIRPPLVETLLAPPASASPVAPDERGRAGSGGINILSVEF